MARVSPESDGQRIHSFSLTLAMGFITRPKCHNELAIVLVLSSARPRLGCALLERMLTHSNVELLGWTRAKKPPEMSIYLSVLAQSKIHRNQGDGWIIAHPGSDDDPCRLRPALTQIRQILDSRPDERVCVDSIFDELRRAPFGIRDGLLPILLVVVLTSTSGDRVI